MDGAQEGYAAKENQSYHRPGLYHSPILCIYGAYDRSAHPQIHCRAQSLCHYSNTAPHPGYIRRTWFLCARIEGYFRASSEYGLTYRTGDDSIHRIFGLFHRADI